MAEKKLVMLVLGVIGIVLLLTAIKAENQGNSYFNFSMNTADLNINVLTQSDLIPFQVCNLQGKAQSVSFETIASRFPFDIQVWEEKQVTSNVVRMNQVCNPFIEWVSNSSFTGNFTNPNCTISYYNSSETSASLIPFTKTTLAPNKKNHRNTTQNQNTCKDFYYKITGMPANKKGITQYNITIKDDENNSLLIDPWALNNWSNKRQINISGDIPMNYTLLVEIDKPDGMNATCTDARFTNSTEDGELGYWLDPYPCNSTTLKAYVRIDNNQSIYLYYNNTAVNTTSFMRNAFLIGDDFNDGLKVNITNDTGWFANSTTNATRVINGELVGEGNADANWWFFNNTLNFQNYTIYTSGKIQANHYGVLFKYTISQHSGYQWQLMVGGTPAALLYNMTSATTSNLINETLFKSYYDTYYNITINVNGSNLNYTAVKSNVSSNRTASNLTDHTYISRLNSFFGIRGSTGAADGYNVTTDYFYVKPLLTPEPTLTIGGSTSSADTSNPSLNITYPRNLSYNINVSVLNYTVSDDNLQACWFSSNNGLTNLTITCGVNMSGVNSTQGSNTWRLWANDTSNNLNETNVTFVVDTITPNINITYPRNITYNINVSILNYTISTEAQSCRFSSNNGLTNQTITCGVNMSGVNSTQGANTWRIYVNDSAGNNNQSNVTFVVDTYAPNITIAYPANNSNHSTRSVNINFSVSSDAQACLYTNTSGLVNYSINCNLNITNQSWDEGTNNVTIYVNDSVGNINSSSVRFIVDITNPQINLTYPLNQTYAINVSILNYTILDENLQSCIFSFDNGITNRTITCGVNVSGANSTIGSNTWLVGANDSVNNVNFSRVTFYMDNSNPNVSLTSPINNTNSTNLTQTFTCNSTDNDLKNISLWIWNSSRTNILNTTAAISGASNTTSWNYTFARYDDYEWNCLAYDTLDNSNWSSSNSTLRIILNNISISNLTWFSRDFAFNNTLIANCSSGNNTRVTAAYFGVRNPAGISVVNYINGSSSYSNHLWNSTYFFLNQTGLWQTNVTCENSYGNTTTSFLNFSVLYDLSIDPTNRNFTATQDKNEPKSFLVYLYDNSSASINLSITTAIINSSNFTMTSPATITINASDSVSNQFTFNFSINASANVPRGVYSGNITISNSSHNISERIDFIYAVNPPAGVPTIYSVSNVVCSGNDTDTCKNNIVMTTKDPEIRAYRINNTGFHALTDCSPRFSEGSSLASVAWITFNVTSFNLSIGVYRDMEIKFSPNTAGSFDGRFEIYCLKSDLGDNPTTSSNNPMNILAVSQFVSGPSGGSGGGAEPPKIIEQIPAVALIKYIDDAGSYTNLQRAQIYSAIYGYCIDLTKGKCVLTDLQVLELQGTLKSKYGIEISTEQVRWWLSQYNNNMIETIQLNKLEVNKWGLRSAIVEVEELKFEVQPSRFDRQWFSISDTFEAIITSNKVLKEAKIIEGDGFSVSIVGNTTARILYKIEPYPPEWTSRILTAKVNYIDEKGNSVFQDIAIRAFRLSFKSILLTTLPIILIGGVLIFAYRKRVEIKEYFMKFRR